MWLRFINEFEGNKITDVVYVEDYKAAQKLIDDNIAVHCTGPDGVAFGEAAPEEIEATLEQEKMKQKKTKIKKGGE